MSAGASTATAPAQYREWSTEIPTSTITRPSITKRGRRANNTDARAGIADIMWRRPEEAAHSAVICPTIQPPPCVCRPWRYHYVTSWCALLGMQRLQEGDVA